MKMRIHFLILAMSLALLGCKVSSPIANSFKKYPEQPDRFTVNSDTEQAELLPLEIMYGDSLLSQLIDSALANNLELQKVKYKIDMLAAGMRAVTGNNLPDLNAFVGVSARRFGRYTIDGVGNFDTNFSTNLTERQKIPTGILPDLNGGFLSNWEIDIWKKLENQRKAAFLRFEKGELGRNLLKTTLVSELANAYYDLVVLDNELEIVDESVKLQQQALEIISAMKEVGESNSLAVELSTAQLLASRALRLQIEQQIIEIENDINFVLGRYPQEIERQELASEAMLLPDIKIGNPVQLLANRPDIKEAELELLATDADLYVARVAFYPSVNLNASIGLQSFRVLNFISPASFALNTVGMGLIPLLNQRQLQANLLATNAERQIAYLDYQEKVLLAFNEVNEYLRKLENIEDILEIKTEEVELLRRSINTSNELFRFGQATYLEVITAQRNALSSQIDLLNVKRDQFKNIVLLYRALGGGWK